MTSTTSLYLVRAHISGGLLLIFVLFILLVLVLVLVFVLSFIVLAADMEKLLHFEHITRPWRDGGSKLLLCIMMNQLLCGRLTPGWRRKKKKRTTQAAI